MEEAYMRFLSGEMDAFEIIVKELQMPLIHFINRYIGNTSIAEDLAEDVFVEILLHRDRYNFNGQAENVFVHHRAEYRHRLYSEE